MARLRNYWVYSVGLLAAWLIVLSVSTVIKGTNQAGAVYIASFGFAIGWVSTTIARYLYPLRRSGTARTDSWGADRDLG